MPHLSWCRRACALFLAVLLLSPGTGASQGDCAAASGAFCESAELALSPEDVSDLAHWDKLLEPDAVARCATALRESGLCAVPGFLTDRGLAMLRGELSAQPPALSDKHHTVFQTPVNASLPEGHARNRLVHARIGFVGRRMLPGGGANASLLEAVYVTILTLSLAPSYWLANSRTPFY